MKDTRPYVSESRDRSKLAPAFNALVARVVEDLERGGFDPLVFEAIRVADRQWWIYGCGRNAQQLTAAHAPEKFAWAGGKIVTNAASHLSSVHGHGLAVDVISKKLQWDYESKAGRAFYDALKVAAIKHGLTSGATWKNPVDPPHIQWQLKRGGVIYAGPSAIDRERTAREGVVATWHAYGAAA